MSDTLGSELVEEIGWPLILLGVLGVLVALALCCGLPTWLYMWTVETLAGAP